MRVCVVCVCLCVFVVCVSRVRACVYVCRVCVSCVVCVCVSSVVCRVSCVPTPGAATFSPGSVCGVWVCVCEAEGEIRVGGGVVCKAFVGGCVSVCE